MQDGAATGLLCDASGCQQVEPDCTTTADETIACRI
jgi:hypothetical protein